MPRVQLVNGLSVLDAIDSSDLTPTEINILMALLHSGPQEISVLVETIRKRNAESYKFVTVQKFHKAVARLYTMKYVVYG